MWILGLWMGMIRDLEDMILCILGLFILDFFFFNSGCFYNFFFYFLFFGSWFKVVSRVKIFSVMDGSF